jgi:hypothetical protein
MSNPKYHDHHAAGIYRAIALRFHMRYVQARLSAEHRGGDLPDHGRLPTLLDADERYNDAIEGMIVEAPDSADAALALVHFAGVLAADRLIGEITQEPVDDEQDAYHQSRALASVAGWLNNKAVGELIKRERGKLRAVGSQDDDDDDPDAA